MKILKFSLITVGLLITLQKTATANEIRDITFERFSIDTQSVGPELYNNGRMQKPIKIKYKAYLYKPNGSHNSREYIELTPAEERYYLKLAEFGETFPQSLSLLYPNFTTTQVRDFNYQMNLESPYSGEEEQTNEPYSLENQTSYETTLYLSYQGEDVRDYIGTINLCVFPNPERKDERGTPISGYPGTNCMENNANNFRTIRVIPGAYASYVEEGSFETNVLRTETIQEHTLCYTVENCNSLRYDSASDDVRHIMLYETQFSSVRPNHILQPIDGKQTHWLALGCTWDNINEPADGWCHVSPGWDWYKTTGLFGNAKVFPHYSSRIGNRFVEAQYYDIAANKNRDGKYTVLGSKFALTNNNYLFVLWGPDGGWAGSSVDPRLDVSMEDNYGNRFRLEAEYIKENNYTRSPQREFIQLDHSTIKVTPIY